MSRTLPGLSLIAVLGACSSDTDQPAGSPDTSVIADLSIGDGPSLAYPSGPYGTKPGEVIANETFLGFKDNKLFCAPERDHKLDMSTKIKLSFADYFAHDCDGTATVKPKQLLWVMVSAGWCVPCITEIRELMKMINANTIDERVAFLDILFEDDDRKPATEAFARTWASQLGLKFPLVLDPSFKMGKYFSRAAVPFNMLVDLKTMKVQFAITGAAFAKIGQEIQSYFAQNP